MKQIFLVGYMGAGKTTLGKLLADKLNLEFIDLDHYIENSYHKTVGSIFAVKGEGEFRLIESNMLHEVGEFENVLIATGGGTPCFHDNMEYMNKQGITVYLKTTPEVLHRRLRIAKGKRPLLRGKSDQELMNFICMNLERRSPMYEKSVLVFNADKLDTYEELEHSVNLLAELVLERLGTDYR